MQSNNIYEVYIYCDTRYTGPYKYGEYTFPYKPIYVGKGSQRWGRKYVHLNYKKKNINRRLANTLNYLHKANKTPIIVTANKAISEERAFTLEKELISLIGRLDLNIGPLFNFTNGGEGHSGIVYSEEELIRRAKCTKNYFNGLTHEELKQHGAKSLAGRHPENIRRGKQKELITKSKKSIEEKERLESERFMSWKKTYYNRTEEDKKITSIKCAIASAKRPQYFITIEKLNTGIIESKFLNEWLRDGYARDGIMYRIKGNKLNTPLYSRTLKHTIIIKKVEKQIP